MKGKFIFLALALGAITASATPVTTATITLDSDQPVSIGSGEYSGDYSWTYTLTVSNGDVGDISTIDFTGLEGVVGVSVEEYSDWSDSSTATSATFSNDCYSYYCSYEGTNDHTQQDGFTVYSTDGTPGTASYSYTVSDEDPGGLVGGPAAAAPEPATFGLTGLALFALGALKFRRS